jgi:hypothetical protein
MSELNAKILREILLYDGRTGVFIWRVRPARNVKKGSIAGRVDGRGYGGINIRGRKYASHRLAWLYVYGEWPKGQIDHINRDPADNRIDNLRDVSGSENCRNRRYRSYLRRGGVKGTSFHKRSGKWQAQICLPVSRSKYLGLFDTEAEAFVAYTRAAEAML